MVYIGAHISISEGYEKAVKQAADIECNTMQFFSRNPRGSSAKALNFNDIKRAENLRKIKLPIGSSCPLCYKFGFPQRKRMAFCKSGNGRRP